MVIGIVGAGASGMCAAIAASENQDNQVLIFERQARVGRKLLATGNGRCNLTNTRAVPANYHGQDPDFASAALRRFSVEKTLAWFAELGLYTVEEPSGRVYPYSDHANSVVDVLRFALQRPNVQLFTGCEITRIRKTDEGFVLATAEESYRCDKLVLACGGLAGTKLGGSMAGYKLLKAMGHQVTRLRPSLVQVKSTWSGCVALKGVRANCHAQICRDSAIMCESTGELQFTEYGLSGPVIFEISRDVCQSAGEWVCRLDFLPDIDSDTLFTLLKKRTQKQLPADELLTGVLHNRLGRVLITASGIRPQWTADSLKDEELQELCRVIKGLEIPLNDTLGMDSAQVTAGGAVTQEFDPTTMESRLVSGLYACGELLDIDGDCGGFNLQWAWSSGMVAGHSAGGVKL